MNFLYQFYHIHIFSITTSPFPEITVLYYLEWLSYLKNSFPYIFEWKRDIFLLLSLRKSHLTFREDMLKCQIDKSYYYHEKFEKDSCCLFFFSNILLM